MDSQTSVVITHPLKEEEDEGSHHGSVHAVVEPLLRLEAVIVVGPGGPGSEHHDGAPDQHHEVHDGHDPAGHLVDGHPDLLAAVDLSVPLGALLVHLGPGVDG